MGDPLPPAKQTGDLLCPVLSRTRLYYSTSNWAESMALRGGLEMWRLYFRWVNISNERERIRAKRKNMSRQDILNRVSERMGFVPNWISQMSDAQLGWFWPCRNGSLLTASCQHVTKLLRLSVRPVPRTASTEYHSILGSCSSAV